VIELHGSIARTRCFDCGLALGETTMVAGTPPTCRACGGFARPSVVWFGESLPREALALATSAARSCDVFLSVGTSTMVEPAASLPFEALAAGVPVIEVNPRRTPLSGKATVWLEGAAGVVLPELVRSGN